MKNNRLDIDKEKLKELYIIKGLSSIKIAKKLDCSKPTVLNWLKRYNIPRRTLEEIHSNSRPKNYMIKCKCGCGKQILRYDNKNRVRRYISGHGKKGRNYEELYGEEKAKKLKKDILLRNRTLTHSDETREKLSKIRKNKTYEEIYGIEKAKELKQFRRRWRSQLIIPKKDTSIEVKIQDYLKQLGISFFTHQYLNQIEHAYQCDIWVPAMNLIIECDGNFWHAHPDKYKDEDLDDRQRLQKEKDVIRTSELIEQGFKVLRLWEKEIKVMDVYDFKKRLISTEQK